VVLGQWIVTLSDLDPDAYVVYDFDAYPGRLRTLSRTWNGAYCHLTLDHGDSPITVAQLLEDAKQTQLDVFEGPDIFKGHRRVPLSTPIWADDLSDTVSYRMLLGTDDVYGTIVLRTVIAPSEYFVW